MAHRISGRLELARCISMLLLATGMCRGQIPHSASPRKSATGSARRAPADEGQFALARPGEPFTVHLTNGVEVSARIERQRPVGLKSRSAQGIFSSGVIEGIPGGTIHLLQYRGKTVGRISVPGVGVFSVRHDRGSGFRAVPIVDPHEEDCITTTAPLFGSREFSPLAPAIADGALGAEDGTRIDLLIVYTTAARLEAGGVPEVEAQALLAVELGNEALANSLVSTQIRVVHMEEIALVEAAPANSLVDLERVADPADGFVDHVPVLRDTHQADIVAVLVGPANTCGVAAAMEVISPDFAPFAYCLANWSCAAGILALPHVIAHVMGCADQREDGGSPALPFAWGYQDPGGAFRTVMTVLAPCPDCPQIMLFSNPALTFLGVPIGVDSGQPDSADNVQALNITRTTVANFRDASCPPIGGSGLDCNENCVPDETDISGATSLDCNGNGVPDECDLITDPDCNDNGIPDACDVVGGGVSEDCNSNGVPDECDFADELDDDFSAFITLFTDGWRMINNSQPLGSATWGPGTSLIFPAHAGIGDSSFMINDFTATAGAGTISDWVFTPEIPLENGTELSFWTRTIAGSTFPDRLQVRLSTSGASADVGSTASSLGDFSMQLVEINPLQMVGGYPTSWTEFTVMVAGLGAPTTGRFAFRYFVTNAGPNGSNSNLIAIDTVRIIAPVPDVNSNGVRDECDIGRGDSNLDGIVGIDDFLAVLAKWGPCPPPCPEDADGDGFVGINEFLNVLANWG